MRKNQMVRILHIILIAIPVVGISDEVPRELANELATDFDRTICGDATFLKCVGVKESACSEAVVPAVLDCDYSPVWREIQKLENNQAANDRLSSEGEIFGSCVNKVIQRRLDVSPLLFEQCITSVLEKQHEEALRKKLRN